MNKYRHKLPKDELKRLAKDISKKMVASDYKNKRVKDPTAMSSDRSRGVKKYVKDFFDRAVVKHKEHEKRRAERDAKATQGWNDSLAKPADDGSATQESTQVDDDIVLTDVEDEVVSATSGSPDRKRKRDEDGVDSNNQTPSETPSLKRVKEDDGELHSPPPPPPPPPEAPAADTPTTEMTEEERSLKEQEEALMRENEEAQRLADEAERSKLREQEAALERENEEAMRDYVHHNGTEEKSTHTNGNHDRMGLDDEGNSRDYPEGRKQEVLSH